MNRAGRLMTAAARAALAAALYDKAVRRLSLT